MALWYPPVTCLERAAFSALPKYCRHSGLVLSGVRLTSYDDLPEPTTEKAHSLYLRCKTNHLDEKEMGNERRRSENANRIIAEHRYWAGGVSIGRRRSRRRGRRGGRRRGSLAGQNFVAVGSVIPAIVTLDLHVISVPKSKIAGG